MGKFAGFLKRAKKIGNFLGKGLRWVNDKIIKPLKPKINNVLEEHGYGQFNKAIDFGSDLIDKHITESGNYNGPSLSEMGNKLFGSFRPFSGHNVQDGLKNNLFIDNPFNKPSTQSSNTGSWFSKSLFESD